MKVWYIHPYAGGPGIGRYWRPFYFGKNWLAAGHRPLIFSASYHHLLEPDRRRSGQMINDGVPYAYIPTIRYSGNGVGRKLSMLIFSIFLLPFLLVTAIKRDRPAAIVYSSPHPLGFCAAWLAAKLLKSKLVFEVRDIWPLSLVELGGVSANSIAVKITGWIEKFAYKHADKVVSLLPCAKGHMVEHGLDPEKFVWIPNGVGLGEYEARADIASVPIAQKIQQLKQQGFFVLVYAGAHGDPNSLHTLLQAFEIIERNKLPIKMFLIGKGERKSDLLSYARKHRLDSVVFFDQQPKDHIITILGQASAGYISLKAQPLFRFGISPNKLWDYMLASIPIVFACKAANNPVNEYGCGVSADPESPEDIASTIIKLYNLSETQRIEMGTAGGKAVRAEYAYERLAEKFIQAIASNSH